jgi:hypothetical protein
MKIIVGKKKIILSPWHKRWMRNDYVRVNNESWIEFGIKRDDENYKWIINWARLLYLEPYAPKQRRWDLMYSPYIKDGKKYADDTLLAAVERYNRLSAFS